MRRACAISASLAAALLAVSGCAPDTASEAESTAEPAAQPAELAKRLAFMAGHVEAGIALYRAGEMEAAAKHMRHPISETHADERAGLETLGFDAEFFRTANDLLAENADTQAAQDALTAAEDHLKQVLAANGGESEMVVQYLMDLIREEYAIAVKDGAVSDAGEYQDAWGFARTARILADDPATPNRDAVRREIDALIAVWPEGAPVPTDNPPSPDTINSQVEAVLMALSQRRA